jgi:hypothetical protein
MGQGTHHYDNVTGHKDEDGGTTYPYTGTLLGDDNYTQPEETSKSTLV